VTPPREATGAWRSRLFVFVGRGATGILSLGLVSFASRRAGLETGGHVATLLAIVAGIAEISDVSSQRHVLRVQAAGQDERRDERLRAFQALRFGLFVVCMVVALASGAGSKGLGSLLNVTFLLSAIWFFLSNSLYARALAEGRFDVLGFGPLVALAIAGATLGAFWRWGAAPAAWAVALSLHAGKLGECVFVAVHTGLGSASANGAAVVREWRDTRFLLFQGTLSAVNGRLIIPLASWAGGAPAAAILSIGLSLVSVVTLLSAAMVIPSYRKWLREGPCSGLAAAFRRARADATFALLVGGIAVVALVAASPWFLRRGLGMEGSAFAICVACVAGSGIFEPVNLFAGACFQLCFRDRLLFQLSIVTTGLSWIGVGVGSRMGGIVGLGVGLLAARASSAVVLCWPLIGAAVRRPADPGSAP
jgi:hypothetical protein